MTDTEVVGHVRYCTVHHNLLDRDDHCYDSWLPGDCEFTTAMIVLPTDRRNT